LACPASARSGGRSVAGYALTALLVVVLPAAPRGGPPGGGPKRHPRPRGGRGGAAEGGPAGRGARAGGPRPPAGAVGERRGLFASESFLMTLEIPRAEQADWWVRGRPARRREVIEAVAALARRFHEAGFHHRDLYLCHFFVQEAGAPDGGRAGG